MCLYYIMVKKTGAKQLQWYGYTFPCREMPGEWNCCLTGEMNQYLLISVYNTHFHIAKISYTITSVQHYRNKTMERRICLYSEKQCNLKSMIMVS